MTLILTDGQVHQRWCYPPLQNIFAWIIQSHCLSCWVCVKILNQFMWRTVEMHSLMQIVSFLVLQYGANVRKQGHRHSFVLTFETYPPPTVYCYSKFCFTIFCWSFMADIWFQPLSELINTDLWRHHSPSRWSCGIFNVHLKIEKDRCFRLTGEFSLNSK